MYHYTRHSGDKALCTSRNCPPGELRQLFEHMQREEQGHYRLAESDLNALGYAAHASKPPAVEAFDRYWASIGPEQYTAYVGAIVVFENVASHLASEIAELLRRLRLANTQSRWLRVHAEADREHGLQAITASQRYLREDPEGVLRGAERAGQLWQVSSALRSKIGLRYVRCLRPSIR